MPESLTPWPRAVFLAQLRAPDYGCLYCDFHSSWDKKAKRAFRKCVLRLKKWGKSTRKRLGKSPISAFANAKRVCKRRKLTLNGPETQRKGFQTRHGPRMPRTVNADSKSTRATSYPERCPGAPPIVAWRRHIVRLAWLMYAQYKRNEVLEAVGTVRQVAAATGVSKTTVAR